MKIHKKNISIQSNYDPKNPQNIQVPNNIIFKQPSPQQFQQQFPQQLQQFPPITLPPPVQQPLQDFKNDDIPFQPLQSGSESYDSYESI